MFLIVVSLSSTFTNVVAADYAECKLAQPQLDCSRKFLWFAYTDPGCEEKRLLLESVYAKSQRQCIASLESSREYRNNIARLRGSDVPGKYNGEQCSSSVECESGYCFPGPTYPDLQQKYCLSAAKNCAFMGELGVNFGETKTYQGEQYRCSQSDGGQGSHWAKLSLDTVISDKCVYSKISQSGVKNCKSEAVTILAGEDHINLGSGDSLCFEPKDENWMLTCGDSVMPTHFSCDSSKLVQTARSTSGELVSWYCYSNRDHQIQPTPSNSLDSLVGVWKSRKFKSPGAITNKRIVTIRINKKKDVNAYLGEVIVANKASSSANGVSEQKVRIFVEGTTIHMRPISVENLRSPHASNYLPLFLELHVTDEGNLRGDISNSEDMVGWNIVFRRITPEPGRNPVSL